MCPSKVVAESSSGARVEDFPTSEVAEEFWEVAEMANITLAAICFPPSVEFFALLPLVA